MRKSRAQVYLEAAQLVRRHGSSCLAIGEASGEGFQFRGHSYIDPYQDLFGELYNFIDGTWRVVPGQFDGPSLGVTRTGNALRELALCLMSAIVSRPRRRKPRK